MTDRLTVGLTLTGAIGAGLNGGVFFAFSTFVMRALGRLPAAGGVSAMQAINREAPSPVFMLLLFGTALVSVSTGVIALADWQESWAPYLLTASALYLVSPIATIGFHVPRNLALDRLEPESRAASETWPGWRSEWTAANHVRTLACVASAVTFAVASRAM